MVPENMGLSQDEAYQELGLQYGASLEDVRRAFRQKALQYHPDKNQDNPEVAAERFKSLTKAYQRLSRPTDKRAWEELDISDILTEDFINEAFKQDIPPFELMYIQQALASNQTQQDSNSAGSKAVWAEGTQDIAQNQTWRRVHQAIQAKQRRKGGLTATPQEHDGKQKINKQWGLFWDFLTEWVNKDEQIVSQQQTYKPNLWSKDHTQYSTGHHSVTHQQEPDGLSEFHDSSSVLFLEGPESQTKATHRRRIGAAWRARALAIQQQSTQGPECHNISLTVASQQNAVMISHEQESNSKDDSCNIGLQQASNDNHSLHVTTTINNDAIPILMASNSQGVNETIRVGHGNSSQHAQEHCEEHTAVVSAEHHVAVRQRRCQWLTWHNCFVWTKRILLVKALLMLMRN